MEMKVETTKVETTKMETTKMSMKMEMKKLLQSAYASFCSNGTIRQFNDRSDIVNFLYQVVDYYKEDREIVQITLHYLDRYLLSLLQSLPLSKAETGTESELKHHADSDSDAAGGPEIISSLSLLEKHQNCNSSAVDGDSPVTVVHGDGDGEGQTQAQVKGT